MGEQSWFWISDSWNNCVLKSFIKSNRSSLKAAFCYVHNRADVIELRKSSVKQEKSNRQKRHCFNEYKNLPQQPGRLTI